MEVQILSLFHVRLIFQNVAYICTYVCFLVHGSGFRPIFSPSHNCLNSGSSLYTYHKPKGGNLWLELSTVLTHCRQGLAQRTARVEERAFISTLQPDSPVMYVIQGIMDEAVERGQGYFTSGDLCLKGNNRSGGSVSVTTIISEVFAPLILWA